MPLFGYSQQELDQAKETACAEGRQRLLAEIYITINNSLNWHTDDETLRHLFCLWDKNLAPSVEALSGGVARLITALVAAQAEIARLTAEHQELAIQTDPSRLSFLQETLAACEQERDRAQQTLARRSNEWAAERRQLAQYIQTLKQDLEEYEEHIAVDELARQLARKA